MKKNLKKSNFWSNQKRMEIKSGGSAGASPSHSVET